VSRTEQKSAPAQDTALTRTSTGIEKTGTVAPHLATMAQLMAGFGEQIQILSAEAARNALVHEKSRQMDEFRAQLRDEATKTVQSVIAASKEDISRQALKALLDAHEAGARINHARWIKKIEQDLETARQHMLRQIKEVAQRIDTLAASATERVQKNMEATRDEAMTRFVSRFREQVTPLLAEANDALQTLAASEAAFKNESRSFCAGIEKQIADGARASVDDAQQKLAQTATSAAQKTTETLQQLSGNIERAAQDNLNSLLASLAGNVNKMLEERTAEISREFTTGIETYTRNYLEQIGKSIAEIPRNTVAQQGHS
jgi:flagellar motility protein MotE (MotC chaperone)